MLTELHVADLGIVSDLTLVVGPGLTAITGETGTGKTPLVEHRAGRAEIRHLDAELAALGGDDRSRARELDLLRFQIGEIEAEGLDDAGEDVALEAEEALLADALAHREALAASYRAVEGPALDTVGAAAAALAGRGPFVELAERLRAVQAELAEIARELRVARDTVEDDPQRLEQLRARRQLLRELTRKYGETLADVRAYAAEARQRLAELESYETRAA